MKQWISKLIQQFDVDYDGSEDSTAEREMPQTRQISEDLATILFVIDVYNKHLLDVESHPVRKVRNELDNYAQQIMSGDEKRVERALFRFRQFFSSYRIDEYTYLIKTFDEFRKIIWDFVDHLSEEILHEQNEDKEILESLDHVREAVEANSIDQLKFQSRHFIDSFIEYQTRKDSRRERHIDAVKDNLKSVKKQLVEANQNMRLDHLTKAYNRKSFDEQINKHWKLFQIYKVPVTLVMLDIDHFKRINDTYGHAIGDYVLQDLVGMMKEMYSRDTDFIARVGGEEFAIILPEYGATHASNKAVKTLDRIRKETLVHDDHKIQFTISMGIAELKEGENIEQWMKRADMALYHSKETGRDRYTVSQESEDSQTSDVA